MDYHFLSKSWYFLTKCISHIICILWRTGSGVWLERMFSWMLAFFRSFQTRHWLSVWDIRGFRNVPLVKLSLLLKLNLDVNLSLPVWLPYENSISWAVLDVLLEHLKCFGKFLFAGVSPLANDCKIDQSCLLHLVVCMLVLVERHLVMLLLSVVLCLWMGPLSMMSWSIVHGLLQWKLNSLFGQ